MKTSIGSQNEKKIVLRIHKKLNVKVTQLGGDQNWSLFFSSLFKKWSFV